MAERKSAGIITWPVGNIVIYIHIYIYTFLKPAGNETSTRERPAQTPANAITKNRNKLKEILRYKAEVKGLDSQGISCTIPRKTVGNVCGQNPKRGDVLLFLPIT